MRRLRGVALLVLAGLMFVMLGCGSGSGGSSGSGSGTTSGSYIVDAANSDRLLSHFAGQFRLVSTPVPNLPYSNWTCQRDYYYAAAIADIWAAYSEAYVGNLASARQDAANALTELHNIDSLCPNPQMPTFAGTNSCITALPTYYPCYRQNDGTYGGWAAGLTTYPGPW